MWGGPSEFEYQAYSYFAIPLQPQILVVFILKNLLEQKPLWWCYAFKNPLTAMVVGQPSHHPPQPCRLRGPTPRKAEGPPWASSLLTFLSHCVHASLLLNYQGCSAAPNRPRGHRHVAGPSACPGCCRGLERLLGLVLFVLRNCLLITWLLFLP